MAIGIGIAENVRANIGEIKEQLIKDLDDNKIDYDIQFDKVLDSGIKETLITMRNPDIEIQIYNDKVGFMRTVNTEYSNLDIINNASDVDIIKHIQRIKEKINIKFNTEDSIISIESLDAKTLNIVIIIKTSTNTARVQVKRDNSGYVYINSIQAL